MDADPTLLAEPMRAGALDLANRIWMAPLTRMRSSAPGDLPNESMAEYYAQRAGAGLIVSEGTQISPQGKGYMATPGIYDDRQVRGWERVTTAVHAEGGKIAAQLWHVGRISHPVLLNGESPVSASAAPFRSRTTIADQFGQPERVNCPTPRALRRDEIPGIARDYEQATRNAQAAGFDAVEIHAAHGYLLHQFLASASNQRTDEYGGSTQNRARLLLQCVDHVIEAWDANRTGVRISPLGTFNGLDDTAGRDTALYVCEELAARDIAYLHLSEPDWAGAPALTDDFRAAVRAAFPGIIVGAGGYDTAKAQTMMRRGFIDAVAFGRSFIANPDLPRRLRDNLPLNEPDPATFYGGGRAGYTDYPSWTAVGRSESSVGSA